MKWVRKHRKFSIALLVILSFLLIFSITFGRYILNLVHDFLLETKAFYFESSTLNINGKGYSINNWDGVNAYTLTLDVTNRKSADKVTSADISYEIKVECPDSVTCKLSKNEGIIYSNEEIDTYQIQVVPKKNFYAGDVIAVKTSVTSIEPYRQTMSATYHIGIAKSKFSYDIEDSKGSKYLTLNSTNSISYYEVSEAFGSYAVGSQVSLEDYAKLSDTDKDKCFSAVVTVTFDPKVVFLDMTSEAYLHRIADSEKTTTINGAQYVSSFSFKVNASSSKSIKFYKDDVSFNYTYPIVNENSIIDVSVKTAK